MFIHLAYKDPPELSLFRKKLSTTDDDLDESVEKDLLVNPACPVRVMLEFIRKRCKLGTFAVFDLCDETGALKGLFLLPTWTDASDYFVHRKVYHIIIFKTENDKQVILPQINRQQALYHTMVERVTRFMNSGEVASVGHKASKISALSAPSKTKTRKIRKTSEY